MKKIEPNIQFAKQKTIRFFCFSFFFFSFKKWSKMKRRKDEQSNKTDKIVMCLLCYMRVLSFEFWAFGMVYGWERVCLMPIASVYSFSHIKLFRCERIISFYINCLNLKLSFTLKLFQCILYTHIRCTNGCPFDGLCVSVSVSVSVTIFVTSFRFWLLDAHHFSFQWF